MAIQFDYNKALKQAESLERLAADMAGKTSKKLVEISDNIDAAWTGKAAAAYRKFVTTASEDLAKKAAYMRSTAEFLRSAAKKIKEAEAAAAEAAKKI